MSQVKKTKPIIVNDPNLECYICHRTEDELRQWLDSRADSGDKQVLQTYWQKQNLRFKELELTLIVNPYETAPIDQGKWTPRLGPRAVILHTHICPICWRITEIS